MPFDAEEEAKAKSEEEVAEIPAEPEGVVEPEPEPIAEQEAKTEAEPEHLHAPRLECHHPHNHAKFKLGDWTHIKLDYHGTPNKTHAIHAVLDCPGMDPERLNLHVKTDASGKGKVDLAWEMSLTAGPGKFSLWGDATNPGGGTAVTEVEFEVVDPAKAPQGDEMLPIDDDNPDEREQGTQDFMA